VIHDRNKLHASLRCFADFCSFRGGAFVISLRGVTIPLLSLVSFVQDGGFLLHEKHCVETPSFLQSGVALLGAAWSHCNTCVNSNVLLVLAYSSVSCH
jgi:hypothetical protein